MSTQVVDELRPRKPGGFSRSAGLALLAHALLIVALTVSVNWRTSEPAGVEAELWAAVPQVAAPKAVEPEPTPPPKPTPAPPQPTPKVEPPPPPPDRDAEIAREKREQKDKLEKQRQEEERQEQQRKDAQLKAAEEKQQQEREEAQAKAEADKKKKADAAKQAAQAEALRKENLKRILGQADATGAADSTGTAAQSAGPSSSYAGRIKARIKPNVVFADEVAGNPMASVEVKVAPDGTIVGRRLVKSSGVQAWDDAVLRAIDRTEVLPRDTDGRVPSSMVIDFRPRDF